MIYLDANATSCLRPAALEAVKEFIAQGQSGNPSSIHSAGQRSRNAVSAARRAVLELILGSQSDRGQLIFTSGGTESCSTLLYGFLGGASTAGMSVVTSAIEHPAMLEPLRSWAAEVCFVKPDRQGRVHAPDVAAALEPKTALVSLMAANNETGALQPAAETARLLRSKGFEGAIVCDGIQALGKSDFSAAEFFDAGGDGIAYSSHKIGGLSGCGAVLLSNTSRSCRLFSPFLSGGAQEGGYRAGTENLAGIVSFGAAAQELQGQLGEALPRLARLRDEFSAQLISSSPIKCTRLTPPGQALVNTLLVHFAGVRADDLVVALDLEGVAVSTGSACSSGKQKPSHVVEAMGYSAREARETVRFSLDWCITEEEIGEALVRTLRVLERMRRIQS